MPTCAYIDRHVGEYKKRVHTKVYAYYAVIRIYLHELRKNGGPLWIEMLQALYCSLEDDYQSRQAYR